MSGIPDRLAEALADRYTIEGELGEGGMATVYLAEDIKHERKVALKSFSHDGRWPVDPNGWIQSLGAKRRGQSRPPRPGCR